MLNPVDYCHSPLVFHYQRSRSLSVDLRLVIGCPRFPKEFSVLFDLFRVTISSICQLKFCETSGSSNQHMLSKRQVTIVPNTNLPKVGQCSTAQVICLLSNSTTAVEHGCSGQFQLHRVYRIYIDSESNSLIHKTKFDSIKKRMVHLFC